MRLYAQTVGLFFRLANLFSRCSIMLAASAACLFAFAHADAVEESKPFSREITLLGGVSSGSGIGIEPTREPIAGFIYARSFKPPKSGAFLLRVIADTLFTQLRTTPAKPLAHLQPAAFTRAALIRFGFSGCYLWTDTWMACMDDGPRISWLLQGSSDAQVLGSFPLGISLHNANLFPVVMSMRAEFGRWESRENGIPLHNRLSFVVVGAGYNW